MVGDTPWDIEAAEKAGIPTIAVRTGGFGVDELEAAARR
jgi:phosphoglycolate phosphatase-like HAD superfamily hydrolase